MALSVDYPIQYVNPKNVVAIQLLALKFGLMEDFAQNHLVGYNNSIKRHVDNFIKSIF